MGRDASIMQEILSAWKSRVVKIWLRYGWDYSSGTSYTIYSCCSQVEKKKRRKGARMIFAETSSRAKRWPVVGARLIAPTGWRGKTPCKNVRTPEKKYPLFVVRLYPQEPGVTCQACQSRSPLATKTSRRPSLFSDTTGAGAVDRFVLGGAPKEAQLLQSLPGVTCQVCQSAPSSHVINTSRRPSLFLTTAGPVGINCMLGGVPKVVQVLNVPLGEFCEMCQSAPSVPTVKNSSRPSAF